MALRGRLYTGTGTGSNGTNSTHKNGIILVLGFYDRKNAGDELYKTAIPNVLGKHRTYMFKCTDDIESLDEIGSPIDCVICGGGDIITAYFMQKAQKLLARYTGPVYALSVGIPYASEASYLKLFDHVFVRSTADAQTAITTLGELNVTTIPDVTLSLIAAPGTGSGAAFGYETRAREIAGQTIHIALCLAQPAFANNPMANQLLDGIVEGLVAVYRRLPQIQIHLLSFNYNESNDEEYDVVVNTALLAKMQAIDPRFPVCMPSGLGSPAALQTFITESIHVVVGMRYHSLIMGLLAGKRVMSMYCSPKISKLMEDIEGFVAAGYQLETDDLGRPTEVLPTTFCDLVLKACAYRPDHGNGSDGMRQEIDVSDKWRMCKNIIDQKKLRRLLVQHEHALEQFDVTLLNTKRALMTYLGLSNADFEALLIIRGPFMAGTDHEAVARLICFCITKDIASPYLWGLASNMKQPDFSLYDSIRYIWGQEYAHENAEHAENAGNAGNGIVNIRLTHMYYPSAAGLATRQAFVNVDMVFQNDFKDHHRSGWAYAVGGLMNVDAHHLLRDANILLDTYVDRTFHWGRETLETMHMIPYQQPWIGVIHHTYDESHSSYNCVKLFESQSFVSSLPQCKGLIALTTYLANDLRASLQLAGFWNVPVEVIYHPIEFLENPCNNFQWSAFQANPNRRVVQIGAWLRDPYAIYKLCLGHNALKLQKTALRGRDMDNYFKPPTMFEDLQTLVTMTNQHHNSEHHHTAVCGHCIPDEVSHDEEGTVFQGKGPWYNNKYCEGMIQALVEADHEVMVIERLTNDEYDALLSQNVVFLYLVDCSAVNTVLECMGRNTPIVVNRHPALQEALGQSYPGFYDTLLDAADILNNANTLIAAHTYLKNRDKSAFHLSNFVSRIQNFVLQCAIQP